MRLQRLAERADRRREDSDELWVALGEPEPAAAGRGRRPYRQPLLLGQRDGVDPAAAGIDVGAGDHHRVTRRLERRGEPCECRGIGQRPTGDDPPGRIPGAVLIGLGVPVVHRDRHERGAPRRQRGVMDRSRDRTRDVLGARRFVAPLDVRPRCDGRVAVGQVRLDRDMGAHLLAGGDHERRLVRLGVEDAADGVPDARRRVQVDVGGMTAGLRESVRHPDDDEFLEAEHVGEVLGEVGEHRQLGRARVAEDRGHPVGTEQLEGRFTDGRHQALFLLGRETRRGAPPNEDVASTRCGERSSGLAPC